MTASTQRIYISDTCRFDLHAEPQKWFAQRADARDTHCKDYFVILAVTRFPTTYKVKIAAQENEEHKTKYNFMNIHAASTLNGVMGYSLSDLMAF